MTEAANRSDGLQGEWLSLEEVAALPLFRSSKRAFKLRLTTNFGGSEGEPRIKAAVRRRFNPGEIICRAGEYGSTAFLILEGEAVATLAAEVEPRVIAGRRSGSLARLRALFERRTERRLSQPSTLTDVGEISPVASISLVRPTGPARLVAGDVFGVDACINAYPREATVRAEGPCVVLEMLRSVLDSIREAGEGGSALEATYASVAVRNTLATTPWLAALPDSERERLAESAVLVTPDADEIDDGRIYREGEPADAVYIVRAGNIKLAQDQGGQEAVFAYLGRGSAFGFEPVRLERPAPALQLICVEPPGAFANVTLGAAAVTIGRKASCQVRFPQDHRTVTREHCRFEMRDGELYLRDLESTNGTLLNGERIREAIVRVGDRIGVVNYVFEIVRPEVEATTVTAAPPRLATASGLDNFEIVRLSGSALRRLASTNPEFHAALTAMAAGINVRTGVQAPDSGAVPALVELNLYNSQNTLLIDLDRCTRCDECVRACADAHGGVTRFTRDGPRFGKYLVTLACRSCTDPKCMVGCPVGSIRREGSLEIRIEDWCIGCQRCANQCPFGNINMMEIAAPGATDPAAQAAPALRATVCDLCAGQDGPNCVYACPHDAAIRVRPAAFLSSNDLR